MAYYFAGDTKRAVQQLNRAARLDPGEVGARLYRAIIGLERNKKALARRDLEAALEADSQHGVVRFYQARLLEMSGKHGEAERVYLDLLDRNPLDGAARVGLARTLQARKERRQAIEQAVKVLGSRPNDRDALRFLAHAERRRGRRRR
jgi:tetratricopeptide (TPR) repeat protein